MLNQYLPLFVKLLPTTLNNREIKNLPPNPSERLKEDLR